MKKRCVSALAKCGRCSLISLRLLVLLVEGNDKANRRPIPLHVRVRSSSIPSLPLLCFRDQHWPVIITREFSCDDWCSDWKHFQALGR